MSTETAAIQGSSRSILLEELNRAPGIPVPLRTLSLRSVLLHGSSDLELSLIVPVPWDAEDVRLAWVGLDKALVLQYSPFSQGYVVDAPEEVAVMMMGMARSNDSVLTVTLSEGEVRTHLYTTQLVVGITETVTKAINPHTSIAVNINNATVYSGGNTIHDSFDGE